MDYEVDIDYELLYKDLDDVDLFAENTIVHDDEDETDIQYE